MRPILVLLHRWFGLFAAIFLFVSGLTGALISWDHELDEWLNPHLFHARATGTSLPALELAARLEAADPRLRVRFMPLEVEPGHTLGVTVEARIDSGTGQPYQLGFNQVAIDPVNGEILGRREWGKVSLDRENLLPFLYKLHYSMHIPDISLIPVGTLFMGIVAIVWVIDSLLALWISFPSRKAWLQSFAFRWQAGGYRLTFDLHRSGGVWLFLLVLTLAITSVSMNLKEQVMRPVVGWFAELTPSPFATRVPVAVDQVKEPNIGRADIIEIARADARQRGVTAPAGGIFYASPFNVYAVGFFEPDNSHGDGSLGNPWLYFDATTSTPLGGEIPGQGSAGDIFLQAMFPLHSGRIAGLPGRILVSLMGLAIATLSVTGMVIWARKRKARQARKEKDSEALATPKPTRSCA
jgi:uncharacterized iron-regulated membrane protein